MTSTHFSESHFDAKAERYHAAIRAVPSARYLELLPFFLILNSHFSDNETELVIADLLCGGGFLTEGFRGCFRQLYGIDVSQNMLRAFPRCANITAIKAALEEQPDILKKVKPNVIISLAGLHHIYEINNGKVELGPSADLQQQLVLAWANCLAPSGIMIIADVTDPTLPAPFLQDNINCQILNRTLAKRADFLFGSLRQSLDFPENTISFPAANLGQYVRSVCEFTQCREQTSPGAWFRNIVTEQGLYGHADHFLNPVSLIKSLQKNGFQAEYYEMPTPWLFPSQEDFIYFFYEKFAFGPPSLSFSDIPQTTQKMIVNKAEEFLGVHYFSNGGVSVGWRLGYYRIVRQVRGN